MKPVYLYFNLHDISEGVMPTDFSFWICFLQALFNKNHSVKNIQLISTFVLAKNSLFIVRSIVTTQTRRFNQVTCFLSFCQHCHCDRGNKWITGHVFQLYFHLLYFQITWGKKNVWKSIHPHYLSEKEGMVDTVTYTKNICIGSY